MATQPASSPRRREEGRAQACLCAKIADDHRGRDTVVLDLTEITPIVDYFVLSTATSRRQMLAIVDDADQALKVRGEKRLGREGLDGDSWILLDYGDIVLHVFSEDSRAAYDLERLWADAKRIDWRAELGLPPAS
ncbi:MAG: ribosome silencing factor [Planctomycetaceae bacterium]